jgi:phage terminase small subunit
MALEPRQRRFCEEYIKDHNGSASAVRAGYSSKASKEIAYDLLTKAHIKEYIQSLQQPIKDQCLIDAATLREGLKTVMDRCLQKKAKMEYCPIDKMMKPKLDSETGEPLFEFDANGAVRAIEQLGKHIGFYEKDNKQQNGTGELAEIVRKFLE